MASFTSILTGVAHGFKKFFGGAVKVAQAAEPFVDIAFPGIAMLYNTTVNEVAKAEAAAIAAGSQTGTGAQKLAMVVAANRTGLHRVRNADRHSFHTAGSGYRELGERSRCQPECNSRSAFGSLTSGTTTIINPLP